MVEISFVLLNEIFNNKLDHEKRFRMEKVTTFEWQQVSSSN